MTNYLRAYRHLYQPWNYRALTHYNLLELECLRCGLEEMAELHLNHYSHDHKLIEQEHQRVIEHMVDRIMLGDNA